MRLLVLVALLAGAVPGQGGKDAKEPEIVLRIVADPAAAARAHEPAPRKRETLRSFPHGGITEQIVETTGRIVLYRTEEEQAATVQPADGELNEHVLEVLEGYPADGTHTYHWPKGGSWKGCTRDLGYRGELLCAGDPEGRAYCCGLTFEVFLRAWMRWAVRNGRQEAIRDLDLDAVKRLQGQWFGSAQDKTCMRTALVENGLGRRLEKLEDAKPGDFVQLWRHDGSGHSVVFLRWEKSGGKITGLRYWSTQKSTRGIGERVERFGDSGSAMIRGEFYLCRVGLPWPAAQGGK